MAKSATKPTKTPSRRAKPAIWQPVKSTDVAAYRYDQRTKELRVRFIKTGEYAAQGVPAHLARDFGASASKGKYFYRVLRPLGFSRG